MDIDEKSLGGFEERLDYRFRDRNLLVRGLSHKSYAHEAGNGALDNETFEFLGDSVLGFVIGDVLFQRFPEMNEGALSKMKAYLVSAQILARLAREHGMGEAMMLGVGEAKSGGRHKDSLLSNVFEALIASVYLDGGIEPTRQMIGRLFRSELDAIDQTDLLFQDYKTALQEIAQSKGLPLPEYVVVNEIGPDHSKRFVVEVRVTGHLAAQGIGSSKKDAQQKAAKEAMRSLTGGAGDAG